MNWYDFTQATPAFGMLSLPSYRPTVDYLSLLAPVLENIRLASGVHVKNVNTPSPYHLEIKMTDGSIIKFSDGNLVLDFGYDFDLKLKPGLKPKIDVTEVPLYSDFSKLLADRFKEIIKAIFQDEPFSARRIGIVLTTGVPFDNPPPGIANYLEKLNNVWQDKLESLNAQFTVILEESEDRLVKCHHHISANQEQEPDVIPIKLDWQSYFQNGTEKNADEIGRLLDDYLLESTIYFEHFGTGV